MNPARTPVGMGRPMLLVGTDKGLFRLFPADSRRGWTQEGPLMAGYRILQVVVSPNDDRELHAAVDHPVWGAHVYRSQDSGATWVSLDAAPSHPAGRFESSLNAIWNLAWSPDGSLMYAGIDPAGLFISPDRGSSWRDVSSLNEHPTRDCWEPSRGLFALHSICVNSQAPVNMIVAISAGGVYRSEDAGESWVPANKGVRAENLADRYPLAGHNVHRVLMHPRDGTRLYRQCYSGVYRSDNGGRDWVEITEGLPSDFGYAIACDPGDPDTVWQIPESSSHLRTTADGRLRVFRSRDAGTTWDSVSNGLPDGPAYVTVLREAMDSYGADPCGVYFGTSSGHVFASHDGGDQWQLAADFLPRVLSVRAVRMPSPTG